MVAARNKLSTKFDNSVFYHALGPDPASASEEVHERNFRDLRYVDCPANYYVHVLFDLFVCLEYPLQFLVFAHMCYLPEADNLEEERMLGVFSPDYYIEPNVLYYSFAEVVRGDHLIFDENMIHEEYAAFISNGTYEHESYFHSFL